MLGGKDNFEVDRALVRRTEQACPHARLLATENRQWLIRVVRYLARQVGIDQFLDIGSGLPTMENTHEAAQRIIPDARVIYVDNDPACLAYGRALLEENEHIRFVSADLRDPHELVSHPAVTRHLDFDRPLALIQCATLHHIADEERPREIMAAYIDALPPWSYVALTHFLDPQDSGPLTARARGIERAFHDSGLGTGFFRGHAEIQALFHGLEMVEPGLARLVDWWPPGPLFRSLTDADQLIVGGVGRKVR